MAMSPGKPPGKSTICTLIDLLRRTGKCLFPARLLPIDGATLARAELVGKAKDFNLGYPIVHRAQTQKSCKKNMSVANPLWGAPRVHGELLKLGIDTLARPASPSIWREGGRRRRRDGRRFCAIMQMVSPRWICLWCRRCRFGCCMGC